MTDRPPRRARRVQLSTPGSSEKMIQKASESKADHVFLDLEDAVAPSQKRDARKKIIEGLKTLNWKGKTRCVRINDLTTEYAYEDIIEVVEGAGEHLDTIMMTKVMTPADVLFAEKVREDRIRSMDYVVVRVVWRDLEDLPLLRRRIEAAMALADGRRSA